MEKIIQFIKKIKEDFMNTPRSIKSITILGILAIAILAFMVINGCNVAPNDQFVYKMQERANKHFPKYKYLIQESSNKQLEKMHNLKEGSVKNEEAIQLKKAMTKAIDGWKYEIDKNVQIIKERN